MRELVFFDQSRLGRDNNCRDTPISVRHRAERLSPLLRLGLSPDNVADHSCLVHQVEFPLDPARKVANAQFGVRLALTWCPTRKLHRVPGGSER